MSTNSKIVLGTAGLFAAALFLYVNGKQMYDKKKMNDAVLSDIQRQKKKIENLYWLEKQVEMKGLLKKHRNDDDEIALKLLAQNKNDEC